MLYLMYIILYVYEEKSIVIVLISAPLLYYVLIAYIVSFILFFSFIHLNHVIHVNSF